MHKENDVFMSTDPTMGTDDTYTICSHKGITQDANSELAQWVDMAKTLSGSFDEISSYPRPLGYGHPPRLSTIKHKERKKRTAKKKEAKRARKRNRR